MRDAIQNGTKSWDVVIAKCLSLSMMTATGSRAGDLAVSGGYTDETSTRLGDMIIKIRKNADGHVVFRSKLTLRFVKGHKHDRSKNHVVALDSALDPLHNTLDPVKMVLALALRTGAVEATTIDQLITTTLACPDRTVQWKRPDWPLHLKFRGAGGSIKPNESASTIQFGKTLRAAAYTAGINTHVVPHDTRRGAARDTSRLPSIGTQGVKGTRALLAHSYNTMLSGVTDEYVGPPTTSTWEQRSEIKPDEDFDLLVDPDKELSHPRRRSIGSLQPLPSPGQGPKRRRTTTSTTSVDDDDDDQNPTVTHNTSLIDAIDWNTESDLVDEFEFPNLQNSPRRLIGRVKRSMIPIVSQRAARRK